MARFHPLCLILPPACLFGLLLWIPSDAQEKITAPEVIAKLSEMVELAAGDIIMTGTPSGVAATVAGDKLECEIEGVGRLTVTIAPPAA